MTAKLTVSACEYCVDGDGNWKSLPYRTATESINKGQTLSFKGKLTPGSSGIGTFVISKSCNLEGNCMSMLFGDDAVNNLSLSGKNYAFYYLFNQCATIKSVSSGFLPATTLADYCYYQMFAYCTSLTITPELPATTLTNYCYKYMFRGCTSLTTAPTLPATTLGRECCSHMFDNCTSLSQVPSILPATTLADYCYEDMFSNCSSLTTAPVLPATTLSNQCYASMFQSCTSLTTAPALPATTLENYCYHYMFRGCTSLTTAPTLPATTLADYCYRGMFQNCSKLNYIKAMFTTKPSTSYTDNWVNGVASTGTFVKNRNATWSVTGNYGIPSGWTVQTA